MALNVKPLGDRVLVEPVEEKEVKKGGIIIPDTAKEKPMESVVVALGTTPNPLIASTTPGLQTTAHGTVVADAKTGKTHKVRITKLYRTFAYAELAESVVGSKYFIGNGSLIIG